MKLFITSVFLIGICFIGIAIKIWSKKKGEFSGTCSGQHRLFENPEMTCSFCGKSTSENCNT